MIDEDKLRKMAEAWGPNRNGLSEEQLAAAVIDLLDERKVRVQAARSLHDLGHLSPEHVGGCSEDEPCECPEYVLVGAVLNDEIKIDDVKLALAAAEDVADVE